LGKLGAHENSVETKKEAGARLSKEATVEELEEIRAKTWTVLEAIGYSTVRE